RLTVRQFPSGDTAIDVREFYVDKKTQELRPGKGICLTLNQWRILQELMPKIDKSLEDITK
ncbi:hypothetical protein INT46_001181, partial [Mucor plumbeus]